MDYSKLSDFEINKRVAKIHGGFALTLAVIDAPPSEKNFHPGRFDPCNNPADAWPIIVSNKIAIVPGTASDKWAAHHGDWDVVVADINPLRSAMIVLLMMQEGKLNAHG